MDPRLLHLELSMWRYHSTKSSYEGIHLNAAPEACETLIHLLAELSAHGGEVHRTIPLKPLDPALDPTGFRARLSSFATLRLEVVDPDDELREMHVRHDGARVTITITRPFVSKLAKALESIRDGGGDFGFGPATEKRKSGPRDRESDLLVFWWQRSRRTVVRQLPIQ